MKALEPNRYINIIIAHVKRMEAKDGKIDKESLIKWLSDFLELDEGDYVIKSTCPGLPDHETIIRNEFYHDDRVLREMLERRSLEEIMGIIAYIKDVRVTDMMFSES